jgi:hypothetical protein
MLEKCNTGIGLSSRRLLLGIALMLALGGASDLAHADKGSGGGGGGGGSGSSGGSDNSGGGSDNSGSGDDGDSAEEHDNEDGKRRDSDDAYSAVKNGQAVSLRQLKNHLSANYPGKILKLEIRALGEGFVYRVKLLQNDHKVSTISLDAKTLARRKN